jgi:hypothetical protein
VIELFLAAAALAQPEQSSASRADVELGATVEAVIKACPRKNDIVAWRIVAERTIELQPGLLVEEAQLTCIINGLKQAKIRYTFEDNRKP